MALAQTAKQYFNLDAKLEKIIESNDHYTIDIHRPACNLKARYKAYEHAKTYKVKPGPIGLVSCTHCGLNKEYLLSHLKYYYRVDIGNRYLVARAKERFRTLREFFGEGYKDKAGGDPTEDFPKMFFLRREEIVKRLMIFC